MANTFLSFPAAYGVVSKNKHSVLVHFSTTLHYVFIESKAASCQDCLLESHQETAGCPYNQRKNEDSKHPATFKQGSINWERN